MKNKTRIDKLLVDLGFFDSREKARTCIMMNGVKIAGSLVNKPGTQIDEGKFYLNYEADPAYISVVDKLLPYVGRGAFKLKAAHEAFDLDFTGKLVLDIGASTGGFTDFALEQGAKQVIALDAGHGQLHYKLQQDPRVINLERTNFREWGGQAEGVTEKIDIVVIDVSFISLITILDKLKSLTKEVRCFDKDLKIIALLKPQFEAGKEIMDKCGGVIKDEDTRDQVRNKVIDKIRSLSYNIIGEIPSPILGSEGNKEYLLYLCLE